MEEILEVNCSHFLLINLFCNLWEGSIMEVNIIPPSQDIVPSHDNVDHRVYSTDSNIITQITQVEDNTTEHSNNHNNINIDHSGWLKWNNPKNVSVTPETKKKKNPNTSFTVKEHTRICKKTGKIITVKQHTRERNRKTREITKVKKGKKNVQKTTTKTEMTEEMKRDHSMACSLQIEETLKLLRKKWTK